MSAREVVAELAALGVRLWVEGDGLEIDAPAGALTDAHITMLREHKAEIVAHLATAPAPSSGPASRAAAREMRAFYNVPEPVQAAAVPGGADWWVIELPPGADVVMACIAGQWRREPDGRVLAWYATLDELHWCLWAAKIPHQTCRALPPDAWREERRANTRELLAELEALPELSEEQRAEADYYRRELGQTVPAATEPAGATAA